MISNIKASLEQAAAGKMLTNYSKRSIVFLLSKLQQVKHTGRNRWIAFCPSHSDKTPSLAIRKDNDKILLKCLSGCSTHEIVSAVDMELSDLFPERNGYSKPIKNPYLAADILRCIQSETFIVAVIAADIIKGEQLTKSRKNCLMVAVGRIGDAYV